MKSHLLSIAAREARPGARLNLVREYLQAHILRSLQDAGGFASLAFQGGTALRFLHGLRRFSEDLDFALERPEHDPGLAALGEAVRHDFVAAGYDVEVRLSTARTVRSATVKFPGLLHETRLTTIRAAKLAIRVEVDSRPPAGAVLETRLVTRHFPIVFRAHDLASCLAGKVHAILARGHTKGRDLFDLGWYLTHPEHPSPNVGLLRSALEQTGWRGAEIDGESWREILRERVSALDWRAVVRDVEPFLEEERDRILLDRDLLLAELVRPRT